MQAGQNDSALVSHRQAIREHLYLPDRDALNRILPLLQIDRDADQRIQTVARNLAVSIREKSTHGLSIDILLREFPLSSAEGVLLMCLAEALLRIPDEATQDRLIQDKIASGDWASHLSQAGSMFASVSAWGLLLTGKVVSLQPSADAQSSTPHSDEPKWQLLRTTISRLGEPVIRASMQAAIRLLSTQFVLGETIEEAIRNAQEWQDEGYRFSYDMLGESARSKADSDRYYQSYIEALHFLGKRSQNGDAINRPGVSLKLTAVHPRFEYAQRDKVLTELIPRVRELARLAASYNLGFTIDAEEVAHLELTLDVVQAVFGDSALKSWGGFGMVIQAYQKRAIDVVNWAVELAVQHRRSMMIRLVKGAYWDSEIKHAQVSGLPGYPVFTRKESTDVNYLALAQRLLQSTTSIYPQFATHNAHTVAAILEMAQSTDSTEFEFQRLHGMGEVLYREVISEFGVPCRVYGPVGTHQELLAYLVRRMLENGANSSFVHNIVDTRVELDDLLKDPLEQVISNERKEHPLIRLPCDLFGSTRRNSKGLDLDDPEALQSLARSLQTLNSQLVGTISEGHTVVHDPANRKHTIGCYQSLDRDGLLSRLDIVSAGLQGWSRLSVAKRAQCLLRLADLFEENRDQLIWLLVHEAGKSLKDAIAEVREAVDFCRYYTHEACLPDPATGIDGRLAPRNPLGVVLCISPWNFPLAIFVGQIVAALVCGNTVLAKPAEQTTLIALRVADLLKRAGIPADALQVIPATGRMAGETLLSDERINAVVFTGSVDTACWISHRLITAHRYDVPLIAETGGLNAMIVDSTALLESVVDDVISSAFRSAGQRCSSLRVLYVQEEIADELIEKVCGAMQELVIGDPEQPATDVGPVIDAAALNALREHQSRMISKATLVYQTSLPDELTDGYFFAPTLYEIEDLTIFNREVFGPIVHVVRYPGSGIDDVINAINTSRFGLTLGIQTRIESRAARIARRVNVGNIYINRDMIGAVVGVQPFGGCGLSGSGPKAGGPAYLRKLSVGVEPKQSGTLSFTAGDPNNVVGARIQQILEDLQGHPGIDEVTSGRTQVRQTLSKASTNLAALLGRSGPLVGPTGESNELRWEPRGHVLAVIDGQRKEWLESLILAWIIGNELKVITDVDTFADIQQLIGELSEISAPELIELYDTYQNQEEMADLVRTVTADAILTPLRLQVSVHESILALKAPLISIIEGESLESMLLKLMREKTVTVNTTAVGGNPSLMLQSMSNPTNLT